MSDEMIDVTPDTTVINALCSQSLTIRLALCEWIDNSLDAGAKTVAIAFGKSHANGASYVRVEDDGCGKADLRSFAVLGRHEKSRSTKSGVHGVGAKDAAFYFGGTDSVFIIRSVHGGKLRGFVVDWRQIIDSNWHVSAPTECDAGIGQSSGTTIVVEPVIRRIPDGAEWQRLIDDLAYTYTPAIKRGVQIKIQSKKRGSETHVLTPWRLPALQPGYIDKTIEVGNKTARVYVGIVRDGERNTKPGLTYMHGFRVLTPASAHGCGSYPVSRIAGFVDVDDSWPRNKNKDGIQNPEPLYEAVLVAIEELLKRAENQGSQLRSAMFVKEVECLVNANLNDAKAKRERGDKSGTVEVKGSGRRHRNAGRKQRGETMPSSHYGSVKIVADHLGIEQGVGRLQNNGVVVLNLDNPAISKALTSDNTLAAAMAACSLIANDRAIHGEGSTLKLRGLHHEREDADATVTFTKVLGDLLSTSDYDGRSAVEAEAAE